MQILRFPVSNKKNKIIIKNNYNLLNSEKLEKGLRCFDFHTYFYMEGLQSKKGGGGLCRSIDRRLRHQNKIYKITSLNRIQKQLKFSKETVLIFSSLPEVLNSLNFVCFFLFFTHCIEKCLNYFQPLFLLSICLSERKFQYRQ